MLVTLNRPKALNALDTAMIEALTSAYRAAERDGARAIVLDGAGGKAFCAGGDVRSIVEDPSPDRRVGREFFVKEYRLNYLIGSLAVPHVALLDGIVMGGGVGVSVHGSVRVATERTLFAMPETAIGLFPDVGSSIFLPRLPGQLGAYLGLTGARLRGPETVAAGLATHFVSSAALPALKSGLAERGTAALAELCVPAPPSPSLTALLKRVEKTFCFDRVEEIVAALEKRVRETSDEEEKNWARETLAALAKASPTSLKVTLRMLREAPRDREGCFAMEHRLSQQFLREKDFFEGVRALLIDKTNDPKWSPATLAEATTDRFFNHNPENKILSLL